MVPSAGRQPARVPPTLHTYPFVCMVLKHKHSYNSSPSSHGRLHAMWVVIVLLHCNRGHCMRTATACTVDASNHSQILLILSKVTLKERSLSIHCRACHFQAGNFIHYSTCVEKQNKTVVYVLWNSWCSVPIYVLYNTKVHAEITSVCLRRSVQLVVV